MVKYTESHEWVAWDGTTATVGITERAQQELREIVHVELPTEGRCVRAGEAAVVLESTKSAIDVYAPVSGTILSVNASLWEHPERINHAAETEGWLFKLKMHHPEEWEELMDEQAYRAYVQG